MSQIPQVLSGLGPHRETKETSLGHMFNHSHTHTAPKEQSRRSHQAPVGLGIS